MNFSITHKTDVESVNACSKKVLIDAYYTATGEKLSENLLKDAIVCHVLDLVTTLREEYEEQGRHAIAARAAVLAFEAQDAKALSMLRALREGADQAQVKMAKKATQLFMDMTGSPQDLGYHSTWKLEALWGANFKAQRLHTISCCLENEHTLEEIVTYLTEVRDRHLEEAQARRCRSTCLLTVVKEDAEREASSEIAKGLTGVISYMKKGDADGVRFGFKV